MRILIADDDRTSSKVLETILIKEGHEVEIALNGVEAWERMQAADAPSLAILDWMMPGMDGPEVASRVRSLETGQHPYIIMLTSRDKKADVIVALDAGADDYLTKPFDAGELRARVEVGRRTIELRDSLAAKAEDLRKALDQIKTLRGIVPICATCKKIRDDRGYWNQVEVYVRDHTEASFSHGICPGCMASLQEELLREKSTVNPNEIDEP